MAGDRNPLVTVQERARWQRRAVRVLGELLAAEGRNLRPLRWTVATRASLTGHFEEYDPAAGRQRFEVWVQVLGAIPSPERQSGGRVHLHAVRQHYDGLVTVAVLADLHVEGTADAR
jgi:hypothetical protein